MKLAFQWLSTKNVDTIEKYFRKIFKNNKVFIDDVDTFQSFLDGELNDFYDKMNSAVVKIDGKDVGITSYYSSFMYKRDVWIGWTGFLDKDIEERFSDNVIKCLETYINSKFKDIDHIRVYIKRNSISTIELYEDMGYTKEDKVFKRKSIPFVVMSKCLRGKFRPWEIKPIW